MPWSMSRWPFVGRIGLRVADFQGSFLSGQKVELMFENEIVLNELQSGMFSRIYDDLPEDQMFRPGSGHGHTPTWIVGHLAIVGEIGQQLLGGSVTHPEWGALFGPGSSGEVDPAPGLSKVELGDAVQAAYAGLRSMCQTADPARLNAPHGIGLFAGTPLVTVRHAVALILTNHFGFHLAQLSSCRRESGHPPLF